MTSERTYIEATEVMSLFAECAFVLRQVEITQHREENHGRPGVVRPTREDWHERATWLRDVLTKAAAELEAIAQHIPAAERDGKTLHRAIEDMRMQRDALLRDHAAQPAPSPVDDDMSIRRFLWLAHGHQGLYGDDGEMQCGRCRLVDYRRGDLTALATQAITARQEANMLLLAAKDPTLATAALREELERYRLAAVSEQELARIIKEQREELERRYPREVVRQLMLDAADEWERPRMPGEGIVTMGHVVDSLLAEHDAEQAACTPTKSAP